ncbi:hypothetical protein SBA3_2070011 [Candidatus Sulfopaludibacter sp. SbA3]|nr:hypothetical protein SBA3_2070011 [Candidatus Sulfopaludibacter sp. SbA3]
MANLRAWLEFALSRNPDEFPHHLHPAGRAIAPSADCHRIMRTSLEVAYRKSLWII